MSLKTCHMTLRTCTYFKFIDIGEEEEDEAEGHDPFTYCTGKVEGVVLGEVQNFAPFNTWKNWMKSLPMPPVGSL